MIVGIQLIGIFFALFLIYLTFIKMKRKEFTVKEALMWFVLWLGFMFVSLFPKALNIFINDVMQMQRPLDFYIILGFMFLIAVTFYTYLIVRKNQKKLDELVTKLAIDRHEKEKDGKA